MNSTPTPHVHFADAVTHAKYANDGPLLKARSLLDSAGAHEAFDALFVFEAAVDAVRWAIHETARGLVKMVIAENLGPAASLELERTENGCIPVAIRHRTGQLLWSRADEDAHKGHDEPAWESRLHFACAKLNNTVWDDDAPEAALARARGDFHEYMAL